MALDLLTANDRLGHYPDSDYTRTVQIDAHRPSLAGEKEADICIIGAGFTGLSAARMLAQKGRDVIVLEASRTGSGASGRNGGQLGTGQRIHQDEIERLFGMETAQNLFRIGTAAKDFVLDIAAQHSLNIDFKPGIAAAEFNKKDTDHAHAYAEHLRRYYRYDKVEPLDAAGLARYVNSPLYAGGVIDWGSGHIHPLKFALGLAQAAEQAGARIYETSRVRRFDDQGAVTATGRVRAKHYIIACNGYVGNLFPDASSHAMPINNFIVATEPLGARAKDILPGDIAVADSKFVVNYYRLSPEGRLLFGGGESYGYRFPRDLAAKARKPMLDTFPQLEGVKIDSAWGGTLAITLNRLPYIRRRDNIWTACGYSGHGVALATLSGALIAADIVGDNAGLKADFETMAAIPHRAFPGGTHMRQPLLVLAMLWYQLRDRLRL